MIQVLIALIILLLIHLYANKASAFGFLWHGRFLSFAAGVSLAYVFVEMLPAVSKSQPILKQAFDGYVFIPYLDKHAYLIALIGVLFSYGLESTSLRKTNLSFWVSMTGYALFNIFVGASLSDPDDPDIQPLVLFVIAMGLHYFVHDHNLEETYKRLYENYGRYILCLALILGWFIGLYGNIPDTIIALVVAFVAGGVMLNVLHYELPNKQKGGYLFFVFGALSYSYILLQVGH